MDKTTTDKDKQPGVIGLRHPGFLSSRAQRIPIDLEYINKYSSWPAIQNPYHETDNPEGIVNLGTAVSSLMDDVWIERMKTISVFEPNYKHFRYYQFWGPNDFRQKLANFMNHFFLPKVPIQFENLLILNGAMLSLDILGFLLADENDVFLCPVPGYGSYFQAGKQRWNIEIVSVPMIFEKGAEDQFALTLESIETTFREQKNKGKRVRALILNNPNNPLGNILSRQVIEDVMKFCQREQIHLIADEMYCMSVFDDSESFQSVLAIRTDELLDSSLMHLIWGFSKDLCLTSYRTGVIYTENPELRLKLMAGSQFQAVPLPIMDMLESIISDLKWFTEKFQPLNHKRLRDAYNNVSNVLNSYGIQTTRPKAGFFLLVDLRHLFEPLSEENCKVFIRKLYGNGVYLTPGWEMRAEPGWFRLVFTSYSKIGINEGLRRMKKTIDEWNNENS